MHRAVACALRVCRSPRGCEDASKIKLFLRNACKQGSAVLFFLSSPSVLPNGGRRGSPVCLTDASALLLATAADCSAAGARQERAERKEEKTRTMQSGAVAAMSCHY